ncbi:MAG: hypothetical protein IJO78_04405 [Erysipelotrichaceae bacterium]|nr:hypothetical protein [Erysipelotrichaceae bacterium]
MKQKEAKFIQMGAGGLGGLFAKTVYVFEVDGRQVKYNFNRFLSGMQPDMNTLGTLTVTDDEEFVSFEYDGGYLALVTKKKPLIEIPKE